MPDPAETPLEQSSTEASEAPNQLHLATPINFLPTHISSTTAKRPRSSSPHPFVPGSPTGSSPKRAMSEDHFMDRQALGGIVTGSASSTSGLGIEADVMGGAAIKPERERVSGKNAEGGERVDQGPNSGMDNTGGSEEMLIDPDLLDLQSNEIQVERQAEGPIEEKPSSEEVLRLIRASSESDLHPDDIIFLLPSTFIHNLSSPNSSSAEIDLVPFIDNEEHDSLSGKLTGTRVVPGTAAEGGFRLRNGLLEYNWDEAKVGAGGKGSGAAAAEADQVELIFIKEDWWRKVVAWYGRPNPPTGIRRTVKSDPQTGFLSIELNPPSFILHKAFTSSSSLASQPTAAPAQSTPVRMVLPAASQLSDLHLAALQALYLDEGKPGPADLLDYPPSRLWRLQLDPSVVGRAQIEDSTAEADRARQGRIDENYDASEESAPTPATNPDRPPSTLAIPSHLLPVCSAKLVYTSPASTGQADIDLADALIEHGDVFAIEIGTSAPAGDVEWMVGVNEQGMAQEMPNASSTAGPLAAENPAPPSPPALPPLFSTGLAFPGTHKEPSSNAKAESSKMGAEASRGITTRSKAEGSKDKEAVRGLRGLQNLGNTCFMNSALQCLSNTEELNRYILSGLYKQELNRSNPLGMGGRVANAFGDLIENIWDTAPTRSSGGYFSSSYGNSVQPRDLKNIVGRFAPQFQGYGQQDTQELLAFLLDGLHEDLNRIDKKPYIEKPDWKDGGGHEELALFGKENWDGYKKRNDSVIVDLFQGQLKSTLTCPASITLDPFMYLTVPLPVKTTKDRDVLYVPKNGDQRMKLTLQYTPNTTFAGLKKEVGELVGVAGDTLLATDEFGHYVYAYWKDDTLVVDARNDDVIVFHQMPFAVQQSNKFQGSIASSGTISVPVYTGLQGRLQSHPFFIHLTLAEAKSPSAIRRAVASGYRALVDHDMEEELFSHARPLAEGDGTGDVAQNVTDLHLDDEASMIAASEAAPSPKPLLKSLASTSSIQSTGPRADLYEIKFMPNSDSDGKSMLSNKRDAYFTGNRSSGYSFQEWVTKKKGYLGRVTGMLHRASEEDNESRVSLLEHGDAIHVQWNDKAAYTYLGRDLRGRYRNAEDYVSTEDPTVQVERKKAELAKKRGITLDDCLAEFSREEVLGENDMWYCPHCKEHRAASKKLDIYQVPDILVIALKRFGARGAGKINVSVDFPISGLDLTSRTQSRQVGEALAGAGKNPEDYGIPAMDEPLIYDLYAVDNHFGGMGGGHYTAHAKNQDDGKWYYFDDSSVRCTDEHDLNGSSAYLLFYHRRSKRPRGAATALKVAEAESAASSMILDPANNPNIARTHPATQEEEGSSPPISTSSSSDSSRINGLHTPIEHVFAWERGVSGVKSDDETIPPRYSPDDGEQINMISGEYVPGYTSPPCSPVRSVLTPPSEDSDGVMVERVHM